MTSLWSGSDAASANACLANVSWRDNKSYHGNSRSSYRGSPYSSASRDANRGGYQRGAHVPSDRSVQEQQRGTQFNGAGGQFNRGQDSSRGQGNNRFQSRGRGTVPGDRNVCWRCGGVGHWQKLCSSPAVAQTHLCFGLRTDEEFGDVSDLRLVDGKIGTQSISVLKDTGCTTAGVRKSLVKSGQYTGQSDLYHVWWEQRGISSSSYPGGYSFLQG